jgi:hypothetical protein
LLASFLALGMVGCEGVDGPGEPSARPFQTPFGKEVADVRSVADAIDALQDTIQKVYVESSITGRAGKLLLAQARLSRGAYEAGDPGRAFALLSGAHGLIETGLARGQVSTRDAAVRLHRSVDLIGVMIAADPP